MIQNNVADDTGTRATLIDPAPIRDTKISSMTKYNFIISAAESKNFEKAEIEQISKAVSERILCTLSFKSVSNG
jgi:hypothetical protein